jgi:hypothetical protein
LEKKNPCGKGHLSRLMRVRKEIPYFEEELLVGVISRLYEFVALDRESIA